MSKSTSKKPKSKTPTAFNTKEFKDLQAEWALKLKESGFDDIEVRAVETSKTSYVMLPGFNKASMQRGNANKKAQYIDLWAAWFWHGEGTETEKLVADYMRQGLSFRELVLKLNDQGVKAPGNQKKWILSLTHPFVTELYNTKVLPFNYKHPMGAAFDNTDIMIEEVMIKEPKPYIE